MDLSEIGKPIRGREPVAPNARRASTVPPAGAAAPPDRVDLSSEASEVMSGYESTRSLAAAAPSVRGERVRDVQILIAEGHYDRPSVRKAIASALAGAFLGLAPRPA